MRHKSMVPGRLRSAGRRAHQGQARRGGIHRRHGADPSTLIMRTLLSSVISLLTQGAAHVAGDLARLQRKLRAGGRMRDVRQILGRLTSGARLLRQWCHEGPFVHPITTAPRPLRFDNGSPTLLSLLVTHFPGVPAQESLAWLEAQGIVIRQPDGCYVPVRHCVRLGVEVVLQAVQYLEAGRHNLSTRDSSRRYADMAVRGVRLPLRHLEDFRAISDSQMHYLSSHLEEWLSARESRDTNEPCAVVSVHLYVHVIREESAAPRGRRRGPL